MLLYWSPSVVYRLIILVGSPIVKRRRSLLPSAVVAVVVVAVGLNILSLLGVPVMCKMDVSWLVSERPNRS